MATGNPDRAFFNSLAMICDGRNPLHWQGKERRIGEEVEKMNGANSERNATSRSWFQPYPAGQIAEVMAESVSRSREKGYPFSPVPTNLVISESLSQ